MSKRTAARIAEYEAEAQAVRLKLMEMEHKMEPTPEPKMEPKKKLLKVGEFHVYVTIPAPAVLVPVDPKPFIDPATATIVQMTIAGNACVKEQADGTAVYAGNPFAAQTVLGCVFGDVEMTPGTPLTQRCEFGKRHFALMGTKCGDLCHILGGHCEACGFAWKMAPIEQAMCNCKPDPTVKVGDMWKTESMNKTPQ
jgi:hypothetical protein